MCSNGNKLVNTFTAAVVVSPVTVPVGRMEQRTMADEASSSSPIALVLVRELEVYIT